MADVGCILQRLFVSYCIRNRRILSFHRVTFLVLDEADRMLDMGFQKQV